jgi:DNA-binding response OmpR family regulator
MLTARTSENDHVSGLEMGADDYVSKPFSPRAVVARVQALLRRCETSAATRKTRSFSVGALEIDRWSRQARVGGRLLPFTPTEFRILETLSRHPGRLYTRAELLAQVFGPDYESLDRTIDTHVTNLRRKLAQCSEEHYVLTVHGLGYRLATQDDLQEH